MSKNALDVSNVTNHLLRQTVSKHTSESTQEKSRFPATNVKKLSISAETFESIKESTVEKILFSATLVESHLTI